MPRLVLPSIKYKKSYLSAWKEFQREGLHTEDDPFLQGGDFESYVKKLADQRKGLQLPKGYVPQTVYWLVDGGRYIGRVSIRHRLNASLRSWGGHIGYAIRPSERRKGYGTMILKKVLPIAKKMKLSKVLLTCDESNIGSIRIIESNGGVYYGSVPMGRGKPAKRRYWISLK